LEGHRGVFAGRSGLEWTSEPAEWRQTAGHARGSREPETADLNSALVAKSLITPRMQDGVRGTSSRCGGGFAKQVAGNVDKSEAPTFLRERIEIRLDENLDGLFAGINLDTNGRVAEIDLVSSSVSSANNGVGIIVSLFRGLRRYQTTFDRSRPQKQSN
jgi:hypothetical protein